MVFRGTSIISGTATVISVLTWPETELGKIDTDLGLTPDETAFEKGIRQFGYMIMKQV
jgi:Mg2+-importing ATPase